MHVRGIEEQVWDEMRIRAIREKRPVGELVNDAFRLYLAQPPDLTNSASSPPSAAEP